VEVSAFYGGKDPRELPFYSQREAADFLGIPRSTLRGWMSWTLTKPGEERGYGAPLIVGPEGAEGRLSFNNLIEAYVLTTLRKTEDVKMTRLRRAIWTARDRRLAERPLLSRSLLVSGDLFWRSGDDLINLSQTGQYVIRRLLDAYLKRIQWDRDERPLRLYPLIPVNPTSETVVIDPRIGFGRPTVAGYGVSTAMIAQRVDAGEPIEGVAEDYDLTPEMVADVLLYERAS
jgi:uncharacterized protein (DUF433 family)